jgi:TolB-like protein/tetratricopeptide (TPR) repeat protein
VPWLVAVMVILATTAVALLILNLRRTATAKPISIAVRPFVDESSAQDQTYFCDGVAEEINARLGLFPALRAVSFGSVIRLRTAETAEFVKQLGLDAILEGRIRKEDGRLRIQVRLSRVAESTPVWEHTFDDPAGTEVAIEDQIVREVIKRLKAGFVRPIRSTKNAEAHDLYLRGRAELRKRPGSPSPEAAGYFRQAIAKDSQYARAFAGLAEAYRLAPEARAAALQALTYDESLGEAHVSLARVLMWTDADWETAEKELNRSRTLTPQYAEAYQLMALILAFRGRNAEAAIELERALDLDPLSPKVHNVHATLLLFARDYLNAIRAARRAVELDPLFMPGERTLGRALVLSGKFDQGIATLWGPTKDPWALAMAGRTDEARRALDELLLNGWVPESLDVARVYAALGDRDQAFHWLDRVTERVRIANIIGPEWDKLRPDPRYAAMLKKIGLAAR